MSIIRVQHNRDYVVMNKTGLEDKRLSFKAKGILAYLLSKPDNWKANINHLSKVSNNGKKSVRTGLQELEKYGYLTRKPIRNDDGTIKEWESIIREISTNCPDVQNRHVDNQHVDNGQVISNDYNKYLKTEEEEGMEIPKKTKHKFSQIFNRTLSDEFYEEMNKIYSNPDIIFKALKIAELNADKPSYLLKILQDWKNNKLTSVTEIDTYIENRKAQKEVRKSKNETTAARPETPEEELEKLYEAGWK